MGAGTAECGRRGGAEGFGGGCECGGEHGGGEAKRRCARRGVDGAGWGFEGRAVGGGKGHSGAAMGAVAAAAGGERALRIGAGGEQRQSERRAECNQQRDGKKSAHGVSIAGFSCQNLSDNFVKAYRLAVVLASGSYCFFEFSLL